MCPSLPMSRPGRQCVQPTAANIVAQCRPVPPFSPCERRQRLQQGSDLSLRQPQWCRYHAGWRARSLPNLRGRDSKLCALDVLSSEQRSHVQPLKWNHAIARHVMHSVPRVAMVPWCRAARDRGARLAAQLTHRRSRSSTRRLARLRACSWPPPPCSSSRPALEQHQRQRPWHSGLSHGTCSLRHWRRGCGANG